MSAHESFSREEEVQTPSERSFGFVFATVFLIVALFPLLGGGEPRWWAIAVSAAFLAAALLVPAVLAPLNRLWFKFGMLLHRVVSPLILGFLFYLVVLPVGLLLRLFGKRVVERGFDRSARSYWIERTPAGPAPDTLRNQF